MKTIKEVKEIATRSGVPIEDIIEETEQGYNPNKPFSVVVSYERLEDLREFARRLEGAGLGIYRADGLDREFGGHAPQNSFVVRGLTQTTGKPEEWRV